MEDEIYMETETFTESGATPNESVTLEDKLDRIEALLNEDIALRETESESAALTGEELSDQSITESGATSSGVVEPNYAQYIYDLLSDSQIRVEVVQEQTLLEKPINDYNISEGLIAFGILIMIGALLFAFINKYTPKRR